MSYDLYLSYSGRKTYLTCPKKYELMYVVKRHVDEDVRGKLFGLAIGKVFEWFYNKRYWASPNPTEKCLIAIDSAIEIAFSQEKFSALSDPDFVKKIRHDLREFVPPTIETIRRHKLLSSCSRSEVDLSVTCSKDGVSLRLGGRSDFIHGPSPVTIIDGKGSAHRDRYVDADQLRWYALMHYIKYHVAPDRLGFLYYRFPDDPIQWISYGERDVRRVFRDTFKIAAKIMGREFEATPSAECKYCKYHCQDGVKYLAEKRHTGDDRVTSSIFEFEVVT